MVEQQLRSIGQNICDWGLWARDYISLATFIFNSSPNSGSMLYETEHLVGPSQLPSPSSCMPHHCIYNITPTSISPSPTLNNLNVIIHSWLFKTNHGDDKVVSYGSAPETNHDIYMILHVLYFKNCNFTQTVLK
jgi:hypothetical protein